MIFSLGKVGAASDESVFMIWRILLLTFVAFIVLGISSMVYNYSINAYDTEAMLFTRTLVDCLAGDGVLNLDELGEDDIFSFCGFNENSRERFFVIMKVESSGDLIFSEVYGNDDLEWIDGIYKSGLASENIAVYEPGYHDSEFNLRVVKDGVGLDSKLLLGVVVQNEEK